MKNPLTRSNKTRHPRLGSQRSWGTLSPLRAIADLESEMDRLMTSSFAWPEEFEGVDFSPPCNIRETEREFVVEFDIPGIKKEDVKIEIENNRLSVSGERSDLREEKDARHFLTETSYGSFMRSFQLPSQVDENKVDARYAEGVLTVTVPKTAATKSKQVKIQ